MSNKGFPYVTLSYAQSIDGCISVHPGKRTRLSSKEALVFTHQLRSEHDGILVGIGTILADNPKLTVRYVKGKNPQPIIVDSNLSIPTDSYLMKKHPLPVWLVVANKNQNLILKSKRPKLKIIKVATLPDGKINLRILFKKLYALGINKLMVEGGTSIINSVLSQKLANKVVITIAPRFLGGAPISKGRSLRLPKLKNVEYKLLGSDVIIMGDLSS
jgi:riboflavin-specific deaminase-like protein